MPANPANADFFGALPEILSARAGARRSETINSIGYRGNSNMDSRSGRMPWAVVLLLLVFVCAISFGLAKLGQSAFGGSRFGRSRVLNIVNLQDLQTTQTGFVYYDGNTVSCIDSHGDARWSYLVGVDAGFRATDYGVAAWSGNTVTLIDSATGETTYNGVMDEPVMSAHIGDRYTAILTGSDSRNSTMVLMENGGRQVNRILLDDMLCVDYGFYSNGTLLWVMVCDTNGTVPVCNIQTYKPSREIVGSISDTQQLVYAVSFQSSQVCVVGDTYIKLFDYAGVENTSRRRLAYGWYLAAWDKGQNDPLMAFVKDAQYSGESDIRDVRLVRSDLDTVVRMPFGCRDLVVSGDAVYGFASDGHMMILPAAEKKAASYRLNIAVDKVYGVTRDHVAVLGSGDSIYLVNLV